MVNNKLDKKRNNIILGIDPGSTTIGYGVISYENKNQKPKAILKKTKINTKEKKQAEK